jgi:hypothetical protein
LTTIDLASWEADPAHRRRAWTALCVAAASIFLFVLDSGLLSVALSVLHGRRAQSMQRLTIGQSV